MEEQLICNQQVGGSTPLASFYFPRASGSGKIKAWEEYSIDIGWVFNLALKLDIG